MYGRTSPSNAQSGPNVPQKTSIRQMHSPWYYLVFARQSRSTSIVQQLGWPTALHFAAESHIVVEQLRERMQKLRPTPVNHHRTDIPFVYKDLFTYPHAFVRQDRIKKSLQLSHKLITQNFGARRSPSSTEATNKNEIIQALPTLSMRPLFIAMEING